ncbi:hypothetical protein HRI_004125600 [Hibiscus trionum]|uniref:Uncharacterized protein n=1 Tax=Hibiscus trionum TaxID=183268 RepID=A0A9W7J0C7_HIBTR|nr:hypothetical protein HRI_004125600 [Hibiscus trionum]
MGNCLTSTKVAAQIDQEEYDYEDSRRQQEPIKERAKEVITASDMEGAAEVGDGALKIIKKKKVVRFKLNEESDGESGRTRRESSNGVVRMRFVVTQKELEQILSSGKDLSKCCSMEELVRVVKSRAGCCDFSDEGFHGGWRPALETIPEEH